MVSLETITRAWRGVRNGLRLSVCTYILKSSTELQKDCHPCLLSSLVVSLTVSHVFSFNRLVVRYCLLSLFHIIVIIVRDFEALIFSMGLEGVGSLDFSIF